MRKNISIIIIIILSSTLVYSLGNKSKIIDKPTTPVLMPVDRAFGDNTGDAPIRVCASQGIFNPENKAMSDAINREYETQRGNSNFTRGSASIDEFNLCMKGRMRPYAAIGDFDDDLLPEVLSYDRNGKLSLYWNNGGVFKKISLELLHSERKIDGSNVIGDEYANVVIVDVNGDGRNDIVGSPHNGDQTIRILFNLGGRKFAKELFISKVEEHPGRPDTSTTSDINRDGISDIIQTVRTSYGNAIVDKTNQKVRIFLSNGGRAPYYIEQTEKMMPIAYPDEPSSSTAGSVSINAVRPYEPFTPVVADFDKDGFEDIFIASDGGGSRIYFRDGEKFVDYTKTSGISLSNAGMGAEVSDFNGDGLLDVFTSEISYEYSSCIYSRLCDYTQDGNMLFINNGDRTFTDSADKYGLRSSGWGWGFTSADLNLDGYSDIFMGVGQNARSRSEEDWASSFHKPYLFLGTEKEMYEESSGNIFRSLIMIGTTSLVGSADFDGDLRPDLIIGGEDISRPHLLINRTSGGKSAGILVKGRGIGGSPLNGEGSTISIKIPGKKTQLFSLQSKTSNYRLYSAGVPLIIGLGSANKAEVTVNFPSGISITRTISAGKINLLSESGYTAVNKINKDTNIPLRRSPEVGYRFVGSK
jgi:hypothetical protein